MKPIATDTAEPIEGVPIAGTDKPGGAAAARELGGRLAGLSLPMQVMVLSVWPMLENLLNFLVGTVDLALAARLRPEALAEQATDALGVAGYVGWLMGMLHAAVGIGAAALVARAVGGQHKRLANAALGQAMLLAVAAGLTIGMTIFAGARIIGMVAGLEGRALELCIVYLRIVSTIAPLSAVLFVGMACLRGAGDTRTPFWVMVAVNITNIIASVSFVYAPAPIGGHGVAGIAMGTAVAWTLGACIVCYVLISGTAPIRLRLIRLRPQRQTARRIIRVGLPTLAESSGMWLGNFAVLMIVGRIQAGGGLVGAHMIAIRLESVSFLPGMALGIAGATLAGQYLGAGRPDRARQAVLLCWALGAGLMSLVGIAFLVIPQWLTSIISDTPLHLEMVPPLLRIAGVIQIFFATYMVLSQALRGAGDTMATMIMSYASTFLVRLPAAYILAISMELGLWGLWLGLCGELVVRGTLFAIRFLRGGWMHVRV